MRNTLFIALTSLNLTLFMAGCGGDDPAANKIAPEADPVVQATPPTPSPSPSPQPVQPFVGTWTNTAKAQLVINQDGTSISSNQKLTWKMATETSIAFSSGSVVVDTCTYQITSTGGLVSPLVINLGLVCSQAGSLSYTKVNS